MKTKQLIIAAALGLAALLPAANAQTNQTDKVETKEQRDARMGWWREDKFGLFIHWGLYAVPAGTYDGKQVAGIGEWIMNRGKIPMAEYQQFAKQFNHVNFNADDWVKAAKDAGMKYIVITSKHHDGFAMFDTQASPWNIVQATPYGKDPLKDLAAACRKYGVKLGFYYSQAQDWNNGGSAAGGKWDKVQERSMDDYINKIAVPQVREILTHYGEFPAVLWWDTPIDMPLRLVSSTELESLKRRNPDMKGNPIFGCVVQGFDDAALNRLYVWPTPENDEELVINYLPVRIVKRI